MYFPTRYNRTTVPMKEETAPVQNPLVYPVAYPCPNSSFSSFSMVLTLTLAFLRDYPTWVVGGEVLKSPTE